ncbi:hypothetical protein BDD12DRAFT_801867 [Trichophaea hybrida]|nr:hypothetical protein BDD12DRAFT_801867 [Trichophaea hybrida]
MRDDWKKRHYQIYELCEYLKCRMFDLRGDYGSTKARRCTYEEFDVAEAELVRIVGDSRHRLARRMSMWHQLMGNILADIIFLGNQIERLGHAPFRWAPASLMKNEIPRVIIDGVGVCDSDGLHVEFVGFIVSDGQESHGTTAGECGTLETETMELYIKFDMR